MQKSVLCWLDAVCEKYGGRTAFCDTNSKLSFSQLNKYSKAAGTCLAKEVPPGNPVAVMTGRHIYTPACFLGVVRAGCFYAPMDASMPKSRLNQILSVINAEYLLVDREHLELARSLDFKGRLFVMEEALSTPPDEALLDFSLSGVTENSPLYVIFTSGSAGAPKGVVTSHRSLMCYIEAVDKVLNLNCEDVLGGQSPLDYIAAVRDIYLPVKTGASTVIIPKNQFAMPKQLFETLNEYRVTTLCWSVAGVELPAKLGAFDLIKPEYLKSVIFSGSVMPCKYLKIWQKNLPGVTFINQYGPTEATASCTRYIVKEQVEDDTVLPVGVPYDNYGILLLNEDGTEAEPGKIGEICVYGPCLALGYYGDRERTEQSFVQNPLNKSYRQLIYKTGDLGSIREDGVFLFHGRKDRQIKHMGHRIELGEIEETARLLEEISECCALYNKPKEQLYLFYTGEAQKKNIVLHFRERLPAFMVPRKLVKLESMPHLPNGKTDMKALEKLF